MTDVRVTSTGDVRVTSRGDRRITFQDSPPVGVADMTLLGFSQEAEGVVANKQKPAYHGYVGGYTELERASAEAKLAAEKALVIAEQEFFRVNNAARGIDSRVPPPQIARHNLTHPQHSPKPRPVTIPVAFKGKLR